MIKGLFQFVFGLIRLAFFLVIFIAIFHTWVIKQAITFSLSHQLGADVSIRNVKMDWRNTGFEIQGLEIGNPYSFPKGVLANIPLMIVSVDFPGIPEGVLRLKTVGIDLRELQVMNVSQKGLNLLDLKPLRKSNEERSPSSREAVQTQVKKYMPKVMIDELIFSIGDISYLNMSGPFLKQSRYKAGIRGATYYNIRGTQDVITIVAGEALKKIGFGYLESQFKKFQDRSVSSGTQKSGFLSRIIAALNKDSPN
ncbi:MAG: hypothetical protein WC530_05130 [Candidatus Omnitrophota bacterium]|jgi:hypothetical protein